MLDQYCWSSNPGASVHSDRGRGCRSGNANSQSNSKQDTVSQCCGGTAVTASQTLGFKLKSANAVECAVLHGGGAALSLQRAGGCESRRVVVVLKRCLDGGARASEVRCPFRDKPQRSVWIATAKRREHAEAKSRTRKRWRRLGRAHSHRKTLGPLAGPALLHALAASEWSRSIRWGIVHLRRSSGRRADHPCAGATRPLPSGVRRVTLLFPHTTESFDFRVRHTSRCRFESNFWAKRRRGHPIHFLCAGRAVRQAPEELQSRKVGVTLGFGGGHGGRPSGRDRPREGAEDWEDSADVGHGALTLRFASPGKFPIRERTPDGRATPGQQQPTDHWTARCKVLDG